MVEIALIVGVLLYQFDWRYVVVILVTVALYMWFTYIATEWRIAIRRSMNESDNDANTKAIDSLLNYETVKYFGDEGARDAALRPLDGALRERERSPYTSLAVLNVGQAAIFTVGLAIVHGDVRARRAERQAIRSAIS